MRPRGCSTAASIHAGGASDSPPASSTGAAPPQPNAPATRNNRSTRAFAPLITENLLLGSPQLEPEAVSSRREQLPFLGLASGFLWIRLCHGYSAARLTR